MTASPVSSNGATDGRKNRAVETSHAPRPAGTALMKDAMRRQSPSVPTTTGAAVTAAASLLMLALA